MDEVGVLLNSYRISRIVFAVRSCTVVQDCFYLIQDYSVWDVLKKVVREGVFSDNLRRAHVENRRELLFDL